MQKAPANKSLAMATIASGSMVAILFQLYRFMGSVSPRAVTLTEPGSLSNSLRFGGLTVIGVAAVMAAHDYISSLPWRRFKVACENTGLFIARESGIRLPKLRRKEKPYWGWRLYYGLPIGLSKTHFENKREEFEAALDAELSFAWKDGQLRVDVLPGKIPGKVEYDNKDIDGGEIPFTVGYGREGLIIGDLVSCPHLLVAGQTGAGKSNFLHQLVASITESTKDFTLCIIDLKRVEFSYLKKSVRVEHTLNGAIKTLESLTATMHERMKFLDNEGYVSAKEWREDNPDRTAELPYIILIVDEFSQLCPVLSKERTDREIRTYAHKMLVDLICLARSLGIHIVIATQRPDADILPGQLKANIPATVCFKVRSKVNSQICLDSDRAALLPSTKELPGRAIWQFQEEREVQTMHLPMKAARRRTQTPSHQLLSLSTHVGRCNVER